MKPIYIALRQILVVFLVGFIFLVNPELSQIDILQTAQANTVKTPEGIYYKGVPNREEMGKEQPKEDSIQQKIQETAENIKEKLNLDEPIPQSTKDFFQSPKIEDLE
jgi:hypothetical protein